MNIPAARAALDQLEQISLSRKAWHGTCIATTLRFDSGRGVAANLQFEHQVMDLFDKHVEHLVRKHRAAVETALGVLVPHE